MITRVTILVFLLVLLSDPIGNTSSENDRK